MLVSVRGENNKQHKRKGGRSWRWGLAVWMGQLMVGAGSTELLLNVKGATSLGIRGTGYIQAHFRSYFT